VFKKSSIYAVMSILFVAAMVLSACAQATPTTAPQATTPPQATQPPAAKLSVGVVLPTKDEPRWIQDETRFNDAFKAAGYDVQILFSQGDSAKEKANVESLISQGVKVIIICPQDATAAAAAADEARTAGVKVISYDRLIRDTAAVDYYVTFDSISVGEAQAQYLVDKASGTGNPLYLYAGAASDNNAFLFFEGAWNVLQPKIADGTFVIKNSSEAVALQDKATLTRDEMGKIIGQVTTDWKFDVAKNLAQANLTAASAADKGNVFILAPNDGTSRSIADTFAADKDVTSYVITGQDAEEPSIQYIIDGKQSMTVLKDVRTLVGDAIAAAVAYLTGGAPEQTTTYNNGKIDVPAKPTVVVTVDKSNVQAAVIDSGYWPASDFTGLPGGAPSPTQPPAAQFSVGVVLPTKDEPRWIQDETRFKDAFTAAGYDVQILFSQGDSAKEKANVESLISQGVKVIIICPQDATAAAAAADEARAAGIKVISYDRLIRETDAVDYYVTFDSISVGEAQAQYLVDKASGTGNPLYLYAGAASDNNAFLFFEGAWNVLQPKIADGTFVIKNSSEAVALQDKATLTRDEMGKIIGQVTTDWKFDVAKNLAQANLTAASAADKGNVFILAPNDGTARSIADTFAADKDVTSYVITGQDAEEPSIQYIIDGKQSMTVLKDVRTLVGDAIAAAVAYLTGGAPEQTTTYNNGKIDVPAKPTVVVTVDKSNVQAAVIDSGYWPASDFTGLP
jgi:ABC-type xylose transport system substrate-binding protein